MMALIWAFVLFCLAYLFPILFFVLIASLLGGICGMFNHRSGVSKSVNRHFTNKP